MRLLLSIWMVLALIAGDAFARGAGPAEAPPPDFAGAQYIDSTGCVFIRSGDGWSPRRDGDGQAVCGFPPSSSAWSDHRSRSDDTGNIPSIERSLTELVVSSGATAGAFASGSNSAEPDGRRLMKAEDMGRISDPDGIGAQIGRELRARAKGAGRLSAADTSDRRFCYLIGMKPASVSGISEASDLTQGLCQGTPESVGATVKPQKQAAESEDPADRQMAHGAGQGPGVSPASAVTNAKTLPAVRAGDEAKAAASRMSGRKTVPAATQEAAPKPVTNAVRPRRNPLAEVPPHAHFVQLGRYSGDEIEATIRAVATLGYPVARERLDDPGAAGIILAGPFPSRERLISALSHLRRSGFTGAFAR
ncbi:SPOR domain-containing protein [Paracoccus aerodenitrificans]|uniref:SPOR domain-containing protein n=1 Tax=Paracoccus aerodenitrificans TaxID=3017781 RepID=UPI0022F0C694|nr:hypothetical protein [Paracoccus aerodenitrificans]WBU64467.1 hypothetical protein PAE61_03210 [Paracoccus aerodenitrificans]